MNTVGQQFGGDWTEQKLDCLRKYLYEYTKIMNNFNFHYCYIDAFAGTGYRVLQPDENPNQISLPDLITVEEERFLDGSARIALQVQPPFKEYIFIEKNNNRFSKLQKLKDEFPNQFIKFINNDANEYLISFCNQTDWMSTRAVVFLDPYGMQVKWNTIEAVASTKAIDLWILFPLGAINRLLERQGQRHLSKRNTLNDFFGDTDWLKVFYPLSESLLLPGMHENKVGSIFTEISKYVIEKLENIFPKVADNPLPLYNSKNVPIYLLCFAAANKKGATTAVKIAQFILDPSNSLNKTQCNSNGPKQLEFQWE